MSIGSDILTDEIDYEYKCGQLTCRIDHIHPDWRIMVQTYEGQAGYHGLIHLSDFQLFNQDTAYAVSFCDYDIAYKRRLWQLIFDVKLYYYDTYQPDVVKHAIKAPYSAARRIENYQRYCSPVGYDIFPDSNNNIWYVKTEVLSEYSPS